MSSGILKRSERHRLVGILLRVRAAVYVVVGIPLLLSPSVSTVLKTIGLGLMILAAAAPFVVRRKERYAGVQLSAAIDVVASYVIWLAVPWAGGLSLILTLWAVAIVVFLSPARSAMTP